ncbi:hypothetical protein [Halorubrum kocurii]|uniref:hypothetical protein n=1 Tax=Halorubrum kocurii TaxID=478441 RepID=UPI0009B5BA64|nr:hypothetical protein [Halorubrum kocurii]
MTNTLTVEYPEAAPYIEEAVDEHGEDRVLENYYREHRREPTTSVVGGSQGGSGRSGVTSN